MTATTVAARPRGSVAGTSNTTGGWRVATRLARREVRRRWGRTLLVMSLVAVPVFGMTALTVLERTARTSADQEFAHQFGRANLVAFSHASPPAGGWPAGTQIAHGRAVDQMGVLAADGTARLAKVTDVDLNNPMTKGAVLLRSGRFPAVAGEALISPNIARAFHVRVGDQLRFAEPAWSERVVGIGVSASNWNDGFIAVRGEELSSSDRLALDQAQELTLVRLPGNPSAAELQRYAPEYSSALDTQTSTSQVRAVNWTLVAGMIALAISGVVISGAFAVGARRQLVTLGQLSANGAGEPLLRRMLALQGAWSGVLGTALGVAAAIITLSLMHGQFNSWIHRDIGPFVWSARDLVAVAITGVFAATVAAWFPARSAARVPVLSALAGRRPLGALPRSIVPIGVAVFGVGVLLLSLVAAASRSSGGDSLAFAAVLGGLLVLSGACCVSPVVVASLVHLGRRVTGAGRVAVRSIVRSRARSAAVVMALAAINAGAIAIGTAFASETVKTASGAAFMPDNTLVLARHSTSNLSDDASTFLPIPASVEQAIRTILPRARWTVRRAVAGRMDDGLPGTAAGPPDAIRTRKRISILNRGGIIVADPAVLQLVGLSRSDLATLQRVGLLALPAPDVRTNGANPLSVTVGAGAAARTISVPRASHHLRATADIRALITPEKAQQLHTPIESAGEVATNPTAFNESQRASIDALTPSINFGGSGTRTAPPDAITEVLWTGPHSTAIPVDTVREIILGVVVFIALIVLAMSLALSAAETRDERDVLVALGAPPRTMRGVAAWKAATLAFTGAALAIPTGFIPVAVAYLAAVHPGERARLEFPWSTALELVLIAPAIAAVMAGVGSAIAQRFRPTQMSTFATD